MAVENITIIIGIGIALIYFILYKKAKLLGSLAMIIYGILTLWYSSKTTDPQAYGIFGWIIVGTGLILLLDWLFSPTKKQHK